METGQTYSHHSDSVSFIDTNTFIERLEGVGYTREQARENIAILIDVMNANLATKNDLQKVEQKLETRIDSSVQELKANNQTFKVDILKWYVGMFIAQTALILALMQYLIK